MIGSLDGMAVFNETTYPEFSVTVTVTVKARPALQDPVRVGLGLGLRLRLRSLSRLGLFFRIQYG